MSREKRTVKWLWSPLCRVVLAYLARSQFGEKRERAGTVQRLRSGSSPSGVNCSESEPSNCGLFLWSDDRPLVILPDGRPSLLELLDLWKHRKKSTKREHTKLIQNYGSLLTGFLHYSQLKIPVVPPVLSCTECEQPGHKPRTLASLKILWFKYLNHTHTSFYIHS